MQNLRRNFRRISIIITLRMRLRHSGNKKLYCAVRGKKYLFGGRFLLNAFIEKSCFFDTWKSFGLKKYREKMSDPRFTSKKMIRFWKICCSENPVEKYSFIAIPFTEFRFRTKMHAVIPEDKFRFVSTWGKVNCFLTIFNEFLVRFSTSTSITGVFFQPLESFYPIDSLLRLLECLHYWSFFFQSILYFVYWSFFFSTLGVFFQSILCFDYGSFFFITGVSFFNRFFTSIAGVSFSNLGLKNLWSLKNFWSCQQEGVDYWCHRLKIALLDSFYRKKLGCSELWWLPL